jgi:geranylgeranyl pyrophosphate synthase
LIVHPGGLAAFIAPDLLPNNMRPKGEDISAGKITMPIAKVMSRLLLKERRKLWGTLSSKPTDSAVIAAVVKQLENCGAIDSCQEQAQELVESAWKKMDPLLRNSRAKIILRAFGWYAIERRA